MVFLIRVTQDTDVSVYDVIQNFFPDKTKDLVIDINEKDIALVKEVRPNVDSKDLEKLARSICDFQKAVCPPKYIGVPTGENQKAHRFGPAGVWRRHCVQSGADGQ